MNKIYLVTSNKGKIESFNNILKRMNLDFEIEMINEEYPEDKSDAHGEELIVNVI